MNPEITTMQPLVSIGIPTFNRAHLLPRAIDSALQQTYANIELVILDNASTDGTASVCREYCERDPRVTYLRQTVNVGGSQNFVDVVGKTCGELFMWLADDDWIEPTFVQLCVKELLRDPQHVLVCGKTRYYAGGQHVRDGEDIDLISDSPVERVREFYRGVVYNPVFYGVMPRSVAMRGYARVKTQGEDWFFVGGAAFLGKVRTIETTVIHRAADGCSETWDKLFAQGYRRSRFPYVTGAKLAALDILYRNDTFGELPRWRRAVLAWHVWAILFRRYGGPEIRGVLLAPLKRSPLGALAKSVLRRARC